MGIIVDGAWALAAWRRGTVPAPLAAWRRGTVPAPLAAWRKGTVPAPPATQGSAFTLPHRL